MFKSARAAALVLTAAVTMSWLVAACASAAPGQSDPATAPSASESTSATLPTVTGSPGTASPDPASPGTPGPTSSSPATSGGTGLAACRTSSLLITVDDSQAQGTAGSAIYPLNFTNTSGRSCEMYGYPGVSFVTAPTVTGSQIGRSAERNRAFAKVTVRLAPGGTAHAWLRVVVAGNYPASDCQPVTAHWLRVYPPGEAVAGYVSHTFSACSSTSEAQLTVLPARAGQAVQGVTP